MCNPGTKEGVTVKEGRFAGVWPANEEFFTAMRGKGGLIGVAVDPLTAHECGNQRYMAIAWLDACLSARLSKSGGKAWMHYVKDTAIPDTTPPPAPTNVRVTGSELTWEAEADLESGVAHFIIERDGQAIGTVPEKPANPFGRPIFQGLQYSDTPNSPLVKMTFSDKKAEAGKTHEYRVIAVNTVGLKSK
jgi:hypothetical protein